MPYPPPVTRLWLNMPVYPTLPYPTLPYRALPSPGYTSMAEHACVAPLVPCVVPLVPCVALTPPHLELTEEIACLWRDTSNMVSNA